MRTIAMTHLMIPIGCIGKSPGGAPATHQWLLGEAQALRWTASAASPFAKDGSATEKHDCTLANMMEIDFVFTR